jgi:hypothetical protein
LTALFTKHFDPTSGRLAKLLDSRVGPNSRFAKALDPTNKTSVIARIEKTVRHLLDTKLAEVLAEFSLDEKSSAMPEPLDQYDLPQRPGR